MAWGNDAVFHWPEGMTWKAMEQNLADSIGRIANQSTCGATGYIREICNRTPSFRCYAGDGTDSSCMLQGLHPR